MFIKPFTWTAMDKYTKLLRLICVYFLQHSNFAVKYQTCRLMVMSPFEMILKRFQPILLTSGERKRLRGKPKILLHWAT